MRPLAAFVLLLTAAIAAAETLVTPAKILDATERGFVLQVGTEPLAVEDTYTTRFWKEKAPSKKDAFKAGDTVVARIKTDADPPQLRELSDVDTGAWLEAIRKQPTLGVVEKVDDRFLHVKLEDGAIFAYRITEKTKVSIANGPADAASIGKGERIWVKGRTLPTLDTFAVEITDTKPAAPAKTAKAPKAPAPKKLPKLPASGSLTGTVQGTHVGLRMFDVYTTDGRFLHIAYTQATKFTGGGKTLGPQALAKGIRFQLTYRRDKFGRLLAQKVELFP